MALVQRLEFRQAQTLVMTPQLQQAIKLLQLSSLDLQEFVQGELDQNPLLERADVDGGPEGGETDGREAGAMEGEGDGRDAAPPGPMRDTVDQTSSEHFAVGDNAPLDADFGNVFTVSDPGEAGLDGAESFVRGQGGGQGFDDAFEMEQAARGPSLRDHLLQQVQVDLRKPADRLIALALIEMLDEAGYLAGDPVQVAERFGCPPERVDAVLGRLQRFDPPGIFARSLKECLGLQLREKNRLDPCMQALLDNLDLLAKRDFAGLRAVCNVDAEDLADMVAEIKALNPKPALAFETVAVEAVVPDILMRPQPDGGWSVELNPETLPRVLVNRRYYTRLAAAARSRQDKEYVSERLQTANWLVKSLHQRATTILKVATEIVRQQDGFFRRGVEHLRPLILRDIADAIGMHESTVSRVTANKFLATPRGVFELKYFFTASIAGADGQAAFSAEAIRYKIKMLIDAEDPCKVLSDDSIVEMLRADGVDIARRTVAKYREAMRISSSVQRRREKAQRL
ncbi:MAG TPA: RNA polymerase factor sigma-54 [Azospirillaceae bacterium]|nr:RNA polymerase factor sigma-54 [Azospirillaceae bacterium]